MRIPEGYRLRKGDVVTVRVKVRYDVDRGDVNVHVDLNNYVHTHVDLCDVLSLESRTWEVGDLVRNVDDHDDRGEVIAVCDGMAWVKTRKGAFVSFDSLALEPDVSPPPELSAGMESFVDDAIEIKREIGGSSS